MREMHWRAGSADLNSLGTGHTRSVLHPELVILRDRPEAGMTGLPQPGGSSYILRNFFLLDTALLLFVLCSLRCLYKNAVPAPPPQAAEHSAVNTASHLLRSQAQPQLVTF
jgi:hypothetical protein